MAKLIIAWLVGAAVFTLGNVYAATPDRPTDEDAIGARAQITLIQAILDDEDEEEDDDLQEDQDDPEGEGDAQDEDDEDEDDLEGSSRQWTSPT